MNKRILIPTDFSKYALNASRYAVDLYDKLNCDFYFLNVFKVEGFTTESLFIPEVGSAEYDAAKHKSEEDLTKFIALVKLHNHNPKHSYHKVSSLNFLSEALKQHIEAKDIDLLVMGTKGATGSKGVIFGSNTVNTMEKIRSCPVLAIPESVGFTVPKEIVFPTNYKSAFKRKELNYIIEIAKMHGASLRILYVNKSQELTESQEKNKQLLDDILELVPHSFHTLSQKNIAKGLTSFVESRDSDMIAFINRKHYFFGSVFSKPLVKEIGYDATVPILALH